MYISVQTWILKWFFKKEWKYIAWMYVLRLHVYGTEKNVVPYKSRKKLYVTS